MAVEPEVRGEAANQGERKDRPRRAVHIVREQQVSADLLVPQNAVQKSSEERQRECRQRAGKAVDPVGAVGRVRGEPDQGAAGGNEEPCRYFDGAFEKRQPDRELVELAEKNIEASISEDNVLADLQNSLGLSALPRIIECFDVSNLGKEHIVAGMVRFVDGKPDKSNYRRFKIKSVFGQDDFASMNEAVFRRYRRLRDEKQLMPDLVIVDGGAGQAAAASSALDKLGLSLPLVGLAKEHEEIYLPDRDVPLRFDANIGMMLLLRQIRDATHDFAVRYNRKRREMKMRDEFTKR